MQSLEERLKMGLGAPAIVMLRFRDACNRGEGGTTLLQKHSVVVAIVQSGALLLKATFLNTSLTVDTRSKPITLTLWEAAGHRATAAATFAQPVDRPFVHSPP